ncbi:MAG: DUF2804 domain-containing protein [Candidatus Izemoplasmatales bacterium]|jgi:hypothetical protein|nr:DUF2804 domain-containing protein [Candidatus Izemoplasmatales bacterium]
MQKRIIETQPLLNDKGMLANPGYATYPVFVYDRNQIKASVWRIKEWDYYCAINDNYGFSCVIADLGYSAMITATFLDFQTGVSYKKTKLLWFVFGKLRLPSSSAEGNVAYHGSGFDFDFIRNENERILDIRIKNFYEETNLECNLKLLDLKDDSLVIATPWKDKPLAFYYNQKINCIPTEGVVKFRGKEYKFSATKDFSVLDWGRGVWTYKNTWFWCSLSGVVGGKRFGMNLGYGFGDTTAATENMIFYDGFAHKLDQVEFHIQEPDFLKPWLFNDNEGRLKMEMKPLLDRQDTMNLGIIKNLGHQVFGKMSGYFILDDGLKIEFKDVIGFAEKITNHY